ncbi:SERPINI1 [Scenedesmus sp. PABB004]|nr:SERPINI1 [Scenedesmus sp. PABB004]
MDQIPAAPKAPARGAAAGIKADMARNADGSYNPVGTGAAWSHNFLNQKPWHPMNFRNQVRKYDAEQKAINDAKAREVALAEWQEEQERTAALAFLSPEEAKRQADRAAISFMYSKPPGMEAALARDRELADKAARDAAAAAAAAAAGGDGAAAGGAAGGAAAGAAVAGAAAAGAAGAGGAAGEADAARARQAALDRLREDPFAAILAARASLANSEKFVLKSTAAYGGTEPGCANQLLLGDDDEAAGGGGARPAGGGAVGGEMDDAEALLASLDPGERAAVLAALEKKRRRAEAADRLAQAQELLRSAGIDPSALEGGGDGRGAKRHKSKSKKHKAKEGSKKRRRERDEPGGGSHKHAKRSRDRRRGSDSGGSSSESGSDGGRRRRRTFPQATPQPRARCVNGKAPARSSSRASHFPPAAAAAKAAPPGRGRGAFAMAVSAASVLGISLFKSLAAGGGAAVISPLSILVALVLALNGATLPSATHSQMWAALAPPPWSGRNESNFNAYVARVSRQVAKGAGPGTELLVANAVFTNRTPVARPFRTEMRRRFRAHVMDAETVGVVNAWAANATRGLVPAAVPEDVRFKLLLANAVYFFGSWEIPFNKSDTQPGNFTTPDGNVIQVHMMHRSWTGIKQNESRQVLQLEGGGFRAVKLPYRGSSLSAIFVLPNASYASLGDAAAALDLGALLEFGPSGPWSAAAPPAPLYLPRFKVGGSPLRLKTALEGLGMTAAFDPDAAEFGRLSPQPLFIEDVIHTAVVEVDEEGTEAAAVTIVPFGPTAVLAEPLVFDRPFFMLLADERPGTLLFIAAVETPTPVGQGA